MPIEWRMEETSEPMDGFVDDRGFRRLVPSGRSVAAVRITVDLPRPCPTCGKAIISGPEMVLAFQAAGRLAMAFCSLRCVPGHASPGPATPAEDSWRDRPPLL